MADKYVVSDSIDHVKVKPEHVFAKECAARKRWNWEPEQAFDSEREAWVFVCERAQAARDKAKKSFDREVKRVARCQLRRYGVGE